MPYIKKEDRPQFDEILKELPVLNNAGELNYVITKIAVKYLKHHGKSYENCSNVTKAFDNAKDEFVRRILSPYEDEKISHVLWRAAYEARRLLNSALAALGTMEDSVAKSMTFPKCLRETKKKK